MSKRTVIRTILVILAISALSIWVFASAFEQQSEVAQKGLKIKAALDDSLATKIVAEIDGIPISASRIELKRLSNAYNREYYENLAKETSAESILYNPDNFPVDDEGILNQIARELFVLKAASEAGISYSNEEIMEIIRAEEEYVKSELEKGDKLMMQSQKEDDEFFKALNMTKTEYYEKIYIDMLRYSHTLIDYCKFYYFESDIFKGDVTFESYIDEAFKNAEITIDKKNIG